MLHKEFNNGPRAYPTQQAVQTIGPTTVVPDYLERRAKFRKEHLDLCWETCDRGELILGGALADPVDGAVLLFQGDSPEVAERFAAADPFVRNGLVARWRVRPRTTVVGETATSPVKLSG